MSHRIKIRIGLNLLAAICLLLITGEYGGTRINVIETLEKQNYDWRIKRADTVKRDDIVIVDIDRDTLRTFGNWPIERDLFADLNEQLFRKYRVRIAAYALPFSERDDTGLRLLEDIEKTVDMEAEGRNALNTSNVRLALDGIFSDLHDEYDYDSHMRESLAGHRVVLGYFFDESGRVQGALPPSLQLTDADDLTLNRASLKPLTQRWPQRRGYSGNLGDYLDAVNNTAGHINVNIDPDGLVRTAPYFIRHAGGIYPSLPLAVYLRLQKRDHIGVNIDLGGLFSQSSIDKLLLGSRSLPMNKTGSMAIRYLGPGGRNVDYIATHDAVFRYVSFADVVNGKVPVSELDDKIAFIGSSSEQLRLLYPTPVNSAMPGVEILATQLANILDENALSRADGTSFSEIILLLLLALALSVVFATLSPLIGAAALATAIAGQVFFALSQWESNNEIWTIVPAIITLVGLFLINTIVGFVFEWRDNRHLQSTFGQYVPPEFAKKIGAAGNTIELEGEGRILSVLFSDIRNFTAISEQLTPRELTLLMNRMLTDLTEVIHEHGGTVDKYIGDAIMAFWNAPLYDEEHAKNAVLAALDMQIVMKKLSDEFVAKGFQEMNLGVGICTGDANVGNMGSNLRMTYTAIGDTVNLASRTESLTKYYKSPILVTDSTYIECRNDIYFRAVDLVRVKGRQQPALLYQPLGKPHMIPGEQLSALEIFEQMRQLYVQGDFAAAQEKLDSYRQLDSNDALAEIYAQRIETLQKNPPTDWDGILTHEEK